MTHWTDDVVKPVGHTVKSEGFLGIQASSERGLLSNGKLTC